jgi:uncharacterized membrane protein YeaQ/YmgE (transglycosylase-associated protein family)
MEAEQPPDRCLTLNKGVKAMEFLWFILIGVAADWLAGQVMKGGGYGVSGDLILGVLGAIVGGFLVGLLGLRTENC